MPRATKFIGDVVVTGTLTTDTAVVTNTITTGSTVDANAAITSDLTLATNKKLQLRDTHAFINSGAQGKVTISADAAAADAISLTGQVTHTDDVLVATSKKVQLRDTHAFLNSGAQGKIVISADAAAADAISLTGQVTHTDNVVFATGKQLKPKGGTDTASSAAATVSQQCGVVTSEALTTAGLAAYTLTLTNTLIAATSVVLVSLCNGSNTQGVLLLGKVTPGTGSATIECRNTHASQAFNGTIVVSFLVCNPS